MVWGLYSLPHLFPEKCLDVSDVADYLGKAHGGWTESAQKYGKSGNKWICIPIATTGGEASDGQVVVLSAGPSDRATVDTAIALLLHS